MKIAFITAELPYPSNSGGRIYTWNRIRELYKLGHEIILYSFKEKNEYVNEEKILEYCSQLHIYERKNGIFKILKNLLKPYSAITRYDKKLKLEIKKHTKVDVLIVDIPQLIYNFPKDKKIPMILTQHNIEYKTFKNIGDESKSILKTIAFNIEALKLYFMEKSIYNSNIIDLYTFISSSDLEKFERIFGRKNTLLLPNGYEITEKRPTLKERRRIVFTGKMDYQPNVEAVKWFCRDILPGIKKQIEDVDFFIVGKNPTIDVLKLSRSDVIVTGTVESVEEYIDSADIIVIPLLSGGGVKIKLIEALGRNSIVISTHKGVEGTNFINKEHLLVAESKEEFCEKCIGALNNPERFSEMRKNAQNFIKESYSWKKISKVYEEKIYEVVNKK